MSAEQEPEPVTWHVQDLSCNTPSLFNQLFPTFLR